MRPDGKPFSGAARGTCALAAAVAIALALGACGEKQEPDLSTVEVTTEATTPAAPTTSVPASPTTPISPTTPATPKTPKSGAGTKTAP